MMTLGTHKKSTIKSRAKFDRASVRTYWHRVFGKTSYSWRSPENDRKLGDSLRSFSEVSKLFDLATILNIRDEIENPEKLSQYEDYASDWTSKGLFSLHSSDGLGAGKSMTFVHALRFWQTFVQKYLEGDIDHALLETLERERNEQADLFIFDPDSCEILTEEAVKDPCPPPCVPNPDATTIDWTRAPNEQPFLNEKTCEYWVPITTEYENVNERPATAIVNEQIEPGMKLILDFVGKESTEDIILSLFSQITTDYFVDFRTKSKVKVLIKLPFDAAFALESKEPKTEDETTDSSEFPLNVVLTAKDIRGNGSMLNLVSRAIGNKYSQQYEILRYRGEMSGIPQDIMLKKEGDRIRQFKTALIDLLEDQNFKFNPTRKKAGVLEAIEIGFKEEFTGI